MTCRHCHAALELVFVDLGSAPPSNAYLSADQLRAPETTFPLRVLVCERCWLVQTEDFARAEELFAADYAYFSSTSSSWLAHAERYVGSVTERFGLTPNSHVVEIASNDGYLLQYVRARGMSCLGIEPTAGTAAAARARGIEVLQAFFSEALAVDLAARGRRASLMVANNVLAHTPDINDFVRGFARLMEPSAVATFEFPHLLRLVGSRQFDTIYHEHFSYLSLTATDRVLRSNGLTIFDVEELPTHGGSLRIFAQRSDTGRQPRCARVDALLACETAAGITASRYYAGFQAGAERLKDDFLGFLLEAKRRGKTVAAYGAAAKGNTLLNFAGIKPDLIQFVVDRSASKVGKFLPGSRIPIVAEARIAETRPDYVVILPWNIKDELLDQLAYVRAWGGRFVVASPELDIL